LTIQFPRKRKRSLSTDPTRQLYKVIELLYTRVIVLEDAIGLDKVSDRVCGLADLIKSIQKDPSSTSDRFECPAASCLRHYDRQDVLHAHIRKTLGVEHEVVKGILDGGYCLQCDKDLGSSKRLARHDNIDHEELSNSRVDSFASLLTTILRKLDTSLSLAPQR
jgi:hypothetical protein